MSAPAQESPIYLAACSVSVMAKVFLGAAALCSVASASAAVSARESIWSCARSSFTPSTRSSRGKTVQVPSA